MVAGFTHEPTSSTIRMEAMLKDAIRSGATVFGTFVKVPAPPLIDVISQAGISCVVVDQEHGALSFAETETLIRAANAQGLAAIVRIPEVTRSNVMHALDSGAIGIMVPMVETVEQMNEAVAESHYPPKGGRGLSRGHRSIGYGSRNLKEYLEEQHKTTLVIGQIETPAGARIAKELSLVDGLDVLFIGPTDLSLSLAAEAGSQNVDDSLEQITREVCRVAAEADIASGTLVASQESLQAALSKGMTFILWGSDLGLLAHATRDLKATLQNIKSR